VEQVQQVQVQQVLVPQVQVQQVQVRWVQVPVQPVPSRPLQPARTTSGRASVETAKPSTHPGAPRPETSVTAVVPPPPILQSQR